jgi:hypothetical protein
MLYVIYDHYVFLSHIQLWRRYCRIPSSKRAIFFLRFKVCHSSRFVFIFLHISCIHSISFIHYSTFIQLSSFVKVLLISSWLGVSLGKISGVPSRTLQADALPTELRRTLTELRRTLLIYVVP